MFYDRAKIYVRSGNGGNGLATFRREKYVPLGGPDGGDGGRGGHVYLRVDPQLSTLTPLNFNSHFRAEHGSSGQRSKRTGKQGDDLYVDVPPGTVVYDDESEDVIADLVEPGETLLVARGGQGGLGNTHFATSTRQAPTLAEKGEPGVERWLRLELKVIADVGLVGLPNAGKSTLLASASAAQPKIADYPFTTLEPNLGVVQVGGVAGKTFVMADIPGLIEGAAEGVGLGHEFLRHVERTRMLIHVLDGSGGLEGRDPLTDFAVINQELAAYSDTLAGRPQIVAINKMDLPETQERLSELERTLAGQGYEVFPISAVTHRGVSELLNRVATLLEELPPSEPVVPVQLRHVYTFESTQPDYWEAERLSNHHYEVRGQKIERVTQMTNFANEEGADRFQRILAGEGISAKLEELGVEPGDIVHIADLELIWDQATLDAERQANAKSRRRRTHRQREQERFGGPIDVDEDDDEQDLDDEEEFPGDH